jgi:hypothetical protein
VRLVALPGYHDEQPLSRRAWTLQEWILSPRTLHFTTHQIFWQCNTLTYCESHVPERSGFLGPRYLTTRKEQHKFNYTPFSWHLLVRNFTERDITFDTDRLPAIAGLARNRGLLETHNDFYACGLWKSKLPALLCWWCTKTRANRRQTHYYAPSWSWACMTGSISFYMTKTGRECLLAEGVDISITLASSDPFGPAARGYIKIWGPLYELRITKRWPLHEAQ